MTTAYRDTTDQARPNTMAPAPGAATKLQASSKLYGVIALRC